MLPSHEQKNLPVVRVRHYGRWVAAAIMLLIAAAFIRSVLTNTRFEWPTVWFYLFNDAILSGLATTLWLTVVAMAIGVTLGTLIAIMRSSDNPLINKFASGYTWIFRGTPLLVQLIFWYNIAALYPTIDIGLPFGPTFVSLDANQYITVYIAAILGLGLNEAAYMSEIVRSGLNSVPSGQREAAEALGMTSGRILLRIVLPQAMRVIIPPTGNQLIGMLKTTSTVSVIAMQELLYSAQLIYSTNFQTIPLLIVASIWYLAVTTILSAGQHYLERHFGKSDLPSSANTPPDLAEVELHVAK
jgi:polar amino acid transport system permease protein